MSRTRTVQTPGEAPAAELDQAATGADQPAQADEVAALREQLARTQQLLAQATGGEVVTSLVVEVDTPHGAAAKAASQHLHLTSAQLSQMVASGEVKLTERHVLCRDGWFVNPAFDKA